ncbi:hypothetical protein PVK06_004782 [Gossypium arboreum]|uniref:Uncharacterized protein n=1 Tax=Gossypium arboreum TaxID=29729 RepID=A0ABR0QTD5_GOSAR|nr:hypothetical protein PVK06_004782 [Gossypium arboreum]
MDSSRPPPYPLIFFGSDLYSVSDCVDTGTAPQIAESSSRPPPPLVFSGSDPYTVSDRVDTSTASQISPSPEMVQMAQMNGDDYVDRKLENETMAAFSKQILFFFRVYSEFYTQIDLFALDYCMIFRDSGKAWGFSFV